MTAEQRSAVAERLRLYPRLRFMGSKYRLLPWIQEVLSELRFSTALDAFSGSGCVAYLLKAMGKQVAANDFLRFPGVIARATIENGRRTLRPAVVERLLARPAKHPSFIERTFAGIFFAPRDLRFLDRLSANLEDVEDRYERALALSALIRACVKRQPRGVFTVAGDPSRYKDGRRDLRLSVEEHFLEQVEVYNRCVFDNGRRNRALTRDVADAPGGFDLVYLDPPYVPRADDNCYVKRYHFLEGLSCYWRGMRILDETRVKKIAKKFTPFAYRRSALAAFAGLFEKFRRSTLVLSYSSNGYPDLEVLVGLMRRFKSKVAVHEREHRYHFGTHDRVERAAATEFLLVGLA